MASGLPSRQISSDDFVESCGAILFDLANLADIKVCLVRAKRNDEWHLAKGRRNYGEARKDAAVREVMEETGFRCSLLPVRMSTRAPGPDSHTDVADKAHMYDGLTEPFWCTLRELKHPMRTKIIWWYIASLDKEDATLEKLPGEAKFEPEFLPCKKALQTLTFQNDREILSKAFSILEETLPGQTTLPIKEDIHDKDNASTSKTLPKSQKGIKRKKNQKDPQPKENVKKAEGSEKTKKTKLRRERKRARRASKDAEHSLVNGTVGRQRGSAADS